MSLRQERQDSSAYVSRKCIRLRAGANYGSPNALTRNFAGVYYCCWRVSVCAAPRHSVLAWLCVVKWCRVEARMTCPVLLYNDPFIDRSEYVQVRIFRERGARPSVRGRFSLPENLKHSRSTTLRSEVSDLRVYARNRDYRPSIRSITPIS